MKALSRKCTAFLLSLTLLLTLAPTALASEALGDDLDLRSTTLNRGAELGEGTFWSNTFSDLRQENYVVYTPNTSVTPIVTYGDYTTATSTVSAAAKRLEEQGLRVVAGINGDYYDTLNGAPLGTVMTDGVLRVASASNYAVGFRADGTAILGAPALAMQVESANTSFSIAAVNQVRYSYGGIYLYTYDFNARRSTGTNAAGYDVVCSAVDGRLSIGEALTLTVDEILPEATDTAVPEGKYVLTANLLSGEENLALLRALAVGDTLTVTVRAADEGWNDVDYMIGALYQLVENGEVCKGLAAGAAPRTAIGQKADGSLVLYTIDGRRKGYSIGASLTQVAQRMIELGCVTALSLDGGGSTTLCVTLPEDGNAGVYNTPSEGSLRAVTNHIFLVASNKPSGTLDHIALRTESDRVLAGAQVLLRAAAIDTNYLP
ncbi:MAG: phosphodiester glycosidase family protein, partial [Oscillospiraceae bacterium]|nr:phosphodiester glycosidase family protein [Oscillospiraceae bacterium]